MIEEMDTLEESNNYVRNKEKFKNHGCSTIGCTGIGNTRPGYNRHNSAKYCPKRITEKTFSSELDENEAIQKYENLQTLHLLEIRQKNK